MKENRLIYDVIPGESVASHAERMRIQRLDEVNFCNKCGSSNIDKEKFDWDKSVLCNDCKHLFKY